MQYQCVKNEDTDEIQVTKSTKQKDSLSSMLFNVIMDKIFQKIKLGAAK